MFKFYTDFAKELDMLHDMLGCGGQIGGAVDRAGQYGIPYEVAAKIRPGKKCPALADFLKKQYADFGAELKQSVRHHNAFWKKRGEFYRNKFEKILEHEMPDYTVRLSVQLGGISDWHGTSISIYAFEYLQPFKDGHEIQTLVWESMLSQTFQDVRKKYGANEIDDHNVWGISELTAVSIYQTDFYTSDWAIGYPVLKPHQRAIKKLYQNRKNWQSYLDKAVKYFQKKPLKQADKKCSR